jgi:heme-degrading monooxygenase HmoA
MSLIAPTPSPPYYAVIFTSVLNEKTEGYEQTATRMVELAEQQPGFLGIESARDGLGITVSYWSDLQSIRKWKGHVEHLGAQKMGQDLWYKSYKVRISKVERDYVF